MDNLITRARQDPQFEHRTDVLSIFLRSTYDDGTTMTRGEIGDELLALLAAGHETTASTLAWAFERISRHPKVLEQLVSEVSGGTTAIGRQPFSKSSAIGRSSTSPAATSPRRCTNSGNGDCRKAIRS